MSFHCFFGPSFVLSVCFTKYLKYSNNGGKSLKPRRIKKIIHFQFELFEVVEKKTNKNMKKV